MLAMDEVKNTFNKFTNVMEKNNRGVQLTCYSVACVSLAVAIRRVRPFSRFRKPSDIPNHFIKERRELTGFVKRIDPNGAVLMVKHKPLVPFLEFGSGELPVKVSGVQVSGLGLSWLQAIVVGNEVRFVPVIKERNWVQCEVLMPQITYDKKHTVINVGETLVKIGFGRVLNVDKPISLQYPPYQNRLLSAENYALKRKLGLKYYAKPTKDILLNVFTVIKKLAKTTTKQVVRIPKVATS